jgi:ParB/RepB/Spo0J family partition protein
MEFKLLPVEDLTISASNIRQEFGSVKDLACSIRNSGLLQPLLVRWKGNKLEVVAGQRRLLACKLAGLREVPAVVKEMSDREATMHSLIENVQRCDVSDMEKAEAVEKLRKMGLTLETVAKTLGVSRQSVHRWLALRASSEGLKEATRDGKIPEAIAEEIALALRDEGLQVKVAEAAAGMSRDTVRHLIKYARKNAGTLKLMPVDEVKSIGRMISYSECIRFTVPPGIREPLIKAARDAGKSLPEMALIALERFLRERGYLV